MWTADREDLGSGTRFRLLRDGAPASFCTLLDALAADADFREWYTRLLCQSPYEACFWEHPPLTVGRLESAAEFVLLDAPALAGLQEDPRPFRNYFGDADGAVVFENLGGDATLVVPTPVEPRGCCAHLASFLRRAPAAAIESLWQATARAVLDSVGERPLWISTSGLGVAWLHIRLDSYPKYYQHAPYRRALS